MDPYVKHIVIMTGFLLGLEGVKLYNKYKMNKSSQTTLFVYGNFSQDCIRDFEIDTQHLRHYDKNLFLDDSVLTVEKQWKKNGKWQKCVTTDR